MIILDYFFGRLGNIIKSLINVICIAIEYNHFEIRFPISNFFTINILFLQLKTHLNKANNTEILKDKFSFFMLINIIQNIFLIKTIIIMQYKL